MRRAAKIDTSQKQAVAYLRERGWRVLLTANLGSGAPDSFVAYRGGFTAAVEWKSGNQARAENMLTEDQREFRNNWPGFYIIATSGPEAEKQLMAAMLAGWKFK